MYSRMMHEMGECLFLLLLYGYVVEQQIDSVVFVCRRLMLWTNPYLPVLSISLEKYLHTLSAMTGLRSVT